MDGSAQIRRLDRADVDHCLRLALDRGWACERTKWNVLLDVGEGWGFDDRDGELGGAVILMRYDDVAFIGMLLVRARLGRRGFGRALMAVALERAGPATVLLYATAEGRPLYERLGFTEHAAATTYEGRWQSKMPAKTAQCFTPAQLSAGLFDQLVAADAQAFGSRRESLMRGLLRRASGVAVHRANNNLSFAIAWRNIDIVHIGPVVADTESGALAVVGALAGQGRMARIRIDVPEVGPFTGWLSAVGLHVTDRTPLMRRGYGNAFAGLSKFYALAMQATG